MSDTQKGSTQYKRETTLRVKLKGLWFPLVAHPDAERLQVGHGVPKTAFKTTLDI